MNRLAEFLQDQGGELSATRLAFLLWAIGVLVAWMVVSISKGVLQPIDSTVVTVIGILMTGKVVQKFGEASTTASGSTAPSTAPAPVQVAPAGGGAA